ncbi:hypothetical protein Tco_0666899 [Tanacetum coccineum]
MVPIIFPSTGSVVYLVSKAVGTMSLRRLNIADVRLLSARKIEESLNVTFDETSSPSKTSPLVDDDLDEEEAIREIEKKNLENVVEDER